MLQPKCNVTESYSRLKENRGLKRKTAHWILIVATKCRKTVEL